MGRVNEPSARLAGLTIPLFSLRTARSMGIGEIPDLGDAARLCRRLGLGLLQILPVGELSGAETSPYGALSAFGIDPSFIAWGAVEDVPDAALAREEAEIARLRATPTVDYAGVRALKIRLRDAAFENFVARHAGGASERLAAFRAFLREQSSWLGNFAMFRALKDVHGGAAWWSWPAPLCDRDANALAAFGTAHQESIERHAYTQWIAHEQWRAARDAMKSEGVELMGDLPFMVGRDSADVWSCRAEFRDDASVGAPPDQFDAEGQEWGLPPYRWETMRGNGFRWLRQRARYAGLLHDRFRIDHLVGFFRTYVRELNHLRSPEGRLLPGYFDPSDEGAQLPHGEAVIRAMIEGAAETGARLIGEDLGVVPDFVRPCIERLGVPGYKVLRWEQRDGRFRDPAEFIACSVACFGTHDTDSVRSWWRSIPGWERDAFRQLPAMRERGHGDGWSDATHEALLGTLAGARSDLVLLLWQDVVGTEDRINTPGTVGPHNWTWRLPATLADTLSDPALAPAFDRVRAAMQAAGRATAAP